MKTSLNLAEPALVAGALVAPAPQRHRALSSDDIDRATSVPNVLPGSGAARVTRVLVQHDDPLLALGAFTALMSAPDVRPYLDGSDALACNTEAIDVVVTDPARGVALAALPAAVRQGGVRTARVLILASSGREHLVRQAFGAGAFAYALSRAGLAELCDAVACVARGTRYISPALAGPVAESLMRESLSPREFEVLSLIAEGHCNKIIARQLLITVATVKVHVKAIMSKLGATSRTHALSIAIERGLA